MTNIIIGILTDASLRGAQTVEASLMHEARLGKAWAPKSFGGI